MKKVKYFIPNIQVKCISAYCRLDAMATMIRKTGPGNGVLIKYMDGSEDVARIGEDGNYDEEPHDYLTFNYDSKFRNGNYVLDTIHLYEIFDAVIDTYTNYDKFLYR